MTLFSRPQGFAFAVMLLSLATSVRAEDRVADLVRVHVEAIGGRERIAALKAMRATGHVAAGGKVMRFTMIAERPDHVRLETESGDRTLVQATDGRTPPWEFDTGQWPPHYQDMPPATGTTFAGDAEYDDPLVGGSGRGFTIEDGGQIDSDGKKLIRLLVTHGLTQTYSLLLDPETYFIVRRIEEKKNPVGGQTHIVTYYADYRPVDGVLVPHQIALVVDGKIVQQTKIDAIEPNPAIPTDAFTRPRPAAR